MMILKKILFGVMDSCLAWFLPQWRRDGRETLSSLRLYINSYRPDIPETELSTCIGLRDELEKALLNWDERQAVLLGGKIETHCGPLPGYRRPATLEVVESFFVIMVVFLGIRTYYAQPFRIPTGSMQPTLNGIIVHPVDKVPGFAQRLRDRLLLGSSYVEEVSQGNKRLVNIEDYPKYMLFTETRLTFDDNSTVTVPSAKGAVIQYLKEQGKITETLTGLHLGSFRDGEVIIRARVDAGDLVIVNRMAYHFRKPDRGETFVFDTRGINTSMKTQSIGMQDQQSGTHYIKRLCGVPGDTLMVRSPLLLVNGKPATEPTIARVMAAQPPYNKTGYQTLSHLLQPNAWLTDQGPQTLRKDTAPNLREYAALGDNTVNSLDSRFWGPVHQFNIIGPATFTLWPFTSHWGCID